MNKAFGFIVLLPVVLGAAAFVQANSSSPPTGVTGAPGESTCAQAGCHDQYPLNSGPGGLQITVPSGRLDGDTLIIGVQITHAGAIRWGFEATVINEDGLPVGELLIVDSVHTQLIPGPGGREYVAHTLEGTDSAQVDASSAYTFRWASPPAADRPDYFRVAAVACDGDGQPDGDWVYAASAHWPTSENCPITLPGDANGSGTITSADIIALVGYVFKGGWSRIWPVPAAGDGNCSGTITAGDIIYLVNFYFKSGPSPCDICVECFVDGKIWNCP